MSARSLTLAEARTRVDQVAAPSYDIHLDLTDPAAGTFGSRSTVRFTPTATATFLELADADAVRVTVDGSPLEAAYDAGRIALTGLAPGVVTEVTVEARLPYVTHGDGMHTFTDPADGETYVSAYCGMDIAHRVFAAFDQNDLKGPLTLSVTADPAWTVLGNGRSTTAGDGHWTFTPTPPVPVALFVVCAGPWHSVTWDHDGLPCGWHARRSLAADLDRDADELRRTTDAVLDHLATLFTEPYPFDSCDQIFVPGLNWGAQENPGCVTYRDELLPRERTSDHLRGFRATVIAHEQAHMWFGNLVTMRWFEDTWLQESFADYLGYRVADDGAGFTGAQARHEISRKPDAYVADERRSTHPVAPLAEEVPDVDAALANFDSISYAKGNSVLRQLATWLGDDAFLAGLNHHLTRHRFGNATLADFLAALDDASDRDVRGWADVWLRTAGFDTVRVARDGEVPVLVREGVRPHRFTVAAYDEQLRPLGQRLVDLADAPVRLDDWPGAVVVPNARGESFVRVRLDEASAQAVRAHLSEVTDDLVRSVLWAAALDLTETGDADAQAHLGLVRRHLPHESDPTVVAGVVSHALRRLVPLRVPAAGAGGAVGQVAATCLAGLEREPAEPIAVAYTEALSVTSADPDLLRTWLTDGRTGWGTTLDPRLRWRVLGRLAAARRRRGGRDRRGSGRRRLGRGRSGCGARARRPPDGIGQGGRLVGDDRRPGLQPDVQRAGRRALVARAGRARGAVRRGVRRAGAGPGRAEQRLRQRGRLGVPAGGPGRRSGRGVRGVAARRRTDAVAARLGGRARRPAVN